MKCTNTNSIQCQLEKALQTDQLILYYQPKVSLVNGRIIGMEALIRWQHPQRGLLSPGMFLPEAQSAGLIPAIGDWVLRSVCFQMAEWQAAGLPIVPIGANVGPEHFEQDHFAEHLDTLVRQTGTDPTLIELELTESTLLEDTERAQPVFERVKEMGIKLAMDDFGSGYSGLQYLRTLPFDFLKIDRSFISNLVTNLASANIVAAVIGMAHSLKLQVVAEGVESMGQVSCLTKLGCDTVQGYYFSPPQTALESEKLLWQGTFKVADTGPKDPQPWVLILDDEIGIVNALKRLIKTSGYRTVGVCSPHEALNLMADHPADIVISDYRMSEMHGLDFLHHVKKLYPQTIRVLISGQADIEVLSEAISKSCVDKFISKPWNNGKLVAFIQQAIDKINVKRKARQVPNGSVHLASQEQDQRLNAIASDPISNLGWFG